MIELVFVIVVLGIIAAIALPNLDRDLRQEAADNVLSAIRYTQQLALLDDKVDPTDANWQQLLWMIKFTSGPTNAYYTISSDTNENGTVEKTECAVEPANGKYMYHNSLNPTQPDESPNVAIDHLYGVNNIAYTGGCQPAKHIAFDNLGRPHNGLATTSSGAKAGNDYATYMSSDCNITFTLDEGDPFSIIIEKETGFAYVDGQKNL